MPKFQYEQPRIIAVYTEKELLGQATAEVLAGAWSKYTNWGKTGFTP